MNRWGIVLFVALFPLAACSRAEPESKQTPPGATKAWNESEIVAALNLEEREGVGMKFLTEEGVVCNVAAVMTTKAAVNLYESAGDAVATTPDKAAGVKILAAEKRTCLLAAQKLLSALK